MLTWLVFQCVGPTVFVTSAQAAFINKLTQTVRTTVPDVDPLKVVHTGATAIRAVFREDQVPGIVEAYMVGIKVAFAIAVAGAGTGLLIGLCNIRGEQWRLNAEKAKDAAVAV